MYQVKEKLKQQRVSGTTSVKISIDLHLFDMVYGTGWCKQSWVLCSCHL